VNSGGIGKKLPTTKITYFLSKAPGLALVIRIARLHWNKHYSCFSRNKNDQYLKMSTLFYLWPR